MSSVEIYREGEVVRYDPNIGHSELVRNLPHYHKVDTGTGEPGCLQHLQWRRRLYDLCRKSKVARKQAIEWCKEDASFFMASFCWLIEPRPGMGPTIRAFNLWPGQLEALAHIERYMGLRTIGLEKSRGEGASWLVLMAFLHRWMFFPLESFGLISKDEKTANDPNNSDSLTFKFMWQLEQIGLHAPWMLPRGWDPAKHFSRRTGSITNPSNKSMVNSWSATGTAGTGGRKTAVLMDELSKFPRGDDYEVMASLQPVTNCRILVSTPYGDSGAYYDAMHTPSRMLKIVLHWPSNPSRNSGLYRWEITEDKPRLLDDGYVYPEDYQFIQDGKLRSPWYDACAAEPDMKADPRKLAQEYDLNYGGSTVKFYPPELREEVEKMLKEPHMVGEIDYDSHGTIGEWAEVPGGKVRIWVPVGSKRPPAGNYVVGVDIAAGLGGSSSSNSAIVVLDVNTGEQVLEWKDSMTPPTECAQQAVAICKWFSVGGEHPLLVWENNGGYGESFGNEVVFNLRYPNCYRQTAPSKYRKKKSNRFGYRTTDRRNVHERVRKYLAQRGVTIRSKNLFTELPQFEYNGDKVVHVGSELREDGATGKAHGDIVTALGMACVGLESLDGGAKQPSSSGVKKLKSAPAGSLGARMKAFEDQRRDRESDLINW